MLRATTGIDIFLFGNIYFHMNHMLNAHMSRRLIKTFTIWVIPCQLTHFFPGPSPILMKFGRLVDPPAKLTHIKFQLIIIIINEATAL